MVLTCKVCQHSADVYPFNGKYYCPQCGCEILNTTPQENGSAGTAECPICKNREGNRFEGGKYRCALCDATFSSHEQPWKPQYQQTYTRLAQEQNVENLQKEVKRWRNLGILFVFLFWPASVYFFYRCYKANQSLKAAKW